MPAEKQITNIMIIEKKQKTKKQNLNNEMIFTYVCTFNPSVKSNFIYLHSHTALNKNKLLCKCITMCLLVTHLLVQIYPLLCVNHIFSQCTFSSHRLLVITAEFNLLTDSQPVL